MKGTLYLIPNTLGNPDTSRTHPPGLKALISGIGVYIVEDVRNARRFLKSIDREMDIDRLRFHELNKHTREEEIPGFLGEISRGTPGGVISEAGVPGVADPGERVIRLAHELGIRVFPLTGPSSILLSLMASGMNGQQFRFHGYLPIQRADRIRRIRDLEASVERTGETQVFIETPYRNEGLLDDLLQSCHSGTRLCIAADLTLESEEISTRSIEDWKSHKPRLKKRPAVFLLGR